MGNYRVVGFMAILKSDRLFLRLYPKHDKRGFCKIIFRFNCRLRAKIWWYKSNLAIKFKRKKDEISSNELKIIDSLAVNAINENLLKTRQNLLETFSIIEIKFAKFDTAKDEQNNLEIRKNALVFALWFGPNFGAITYDICSKNSPKITDAKTLYYEKNPRKSFAWKRRWNRQRYSAKFEWICFNS